MTGVRVIDVDASGRDANGDDYSTRATRRAIRAGLMLNVPVRLRYPDGREVEAVAVHVTPAGLDELRRILPIADRPARGRA